MSTIHVERGVQFKAELYKGPDRSAWFKAMGDELAARKLSITVAPGVVIKNGDDAVAFFKRYQSDKTGLQTALGLPAGMRLENYFYDLVHALDDCVKPTSDVKDKLLDFGVSSEASKLLGLDSNASYASRKTQIGAAAADKTFSVLGIRLSRTAPPPDPLKDTLYMDATTFANMPSYSWARDSVELEQVMGVSGMESKELLDILRKTSGNGRTTFHRLRKPEVCEAYSVGYSGVGIDEMKWDADSHRTREANKFVSLVIESGRFEVDPDDARREINLGTDKMDDIYYDTEKFDLLDNQYSVRARARWDTDTEIRRILIGVKTGTEIDEFGLKRCGKVDVRNDGASAEEIKNLDTDLRRGKTSWNGREEAVKPLKGLYDGLNEKGVLPDVGPHENVLLLQPKVHVRSVRARYHLNESDLDAMKRHYQACTTPRAQLVLDVIARNKAALSGAELEQANALEAAAKGLMDGSAFAARAEARLKELDPAMTVNADSIKALMPGVTVNSWNRPQNDALSIEKKRVVAEAMDEAYHAFAEQLDGARDVISQAQDRALSGHAEMFVEWAKSTDTTLTLKTTYDPFVAKYDAIAARPAAEQEAALKEFNAYGEKQKADGNRDFRRFTPLTADQFKALRNHLVNEQLDIAHRQLESGGSMARALWFDEARQFYVPKSTRNTGNFLIDTTDMSEFVKHADWESVPEGERTPAHEIPKDKIFHTMLVNETQIELGLEKPYLDRMAELQAAIHADEASLVMKYFASVNQPGVDAANPATNHAALQALLGKPAAERDAELTKLNAFLTSEKSALQPLTAAGLGRLGADLFTAQNRDKPVRTTPDLEKNLEGARFIFQQYRDVQDHIVRSKGERILDVLRDAGAPNGIEWSQTDASKGDTAMNILAGRG